MKNERAFMALALAAGGIFALAIGIRSAQPLFISSINSATGIGYATISLAFAVAQLVWGIGQPVTGAIGDRWGPRPVMLAGAVLLALGTAAIPFVHTEGELIAALGILSATGAGAASFSILIGSMMQRLPPERRSFAAGFVNAGGSLGQFVFAPIVQAVISSFGWVTAMFALAATSLLTVPLAWPMRRREAIHIATGAAAVPMTTLWAQLRIAAAEPSYWLLHLGFFTCGFHVAFLVTHLPGEVRLCGLPASISANALAIIGLANIAGSLGAGWLGNRVRMKHLLFWLYLSRAVAVLLYLMAPKTALTFYVFAGVLGVTWLSTVPPTAGLVGKLFGVRYLATLFGLTLLSHQLGGFYGAWLGGLAVANFGDYGWMWYADALLATMAALTNLPIREAPVARRAAVA